MPAKLIMLISFLLSLTAPPPGECSPGGCCSFVDKEGWNCFPVAGPKDCLSDFGYLACDPGTCMGSGMCNAGHGGGQFQENCCD